MCLNNFIHKETRVSHRCRLDMSMLLLFVHCMHRAFGIDSAFVFVKKQRRLPGQHDSVAVHLHKTKNQKPAESVNTPTTDERQIPNARMLEWSNAKCSNGMLKSQLPNAKWKMANAQMLKCQKPKAKSQKPNAKCSNAKCQMPNAKCQMFKCQMLKRSNTQMPDAQISNAKS